MNETTNRSERVFPVPLWLLALGALAFEFAVYGALVNHLLFQDGRFKAGIALLFVLPFLARLIVALLSYGLSRWKGIVVPGELRMSMAGWLRFFCVEYGHLCIQNLLLIPLRALFHTQSERGVSVASGPVVLLQHGYFNNGAAWHFTARALERAGFRVFTIDQPVFASIDVMGDRLAKRIDDVLLQTGASKLFLVAHSMGGLVCRAYLRRYGDHGSAHIQRLITMGTPHYGTYHAYLASGPNGQQMRPGNAWLTTLAKTVVTVPFTSIYSVHDTVISPQDSSVMSEAVSVRLSAIGHVSMPSGRAARPALVAALR